MGEIRKRRVKNRRSKNDKEIKRAQTEIKLMKDRVRDFEGQTDKKKTGESH